MSGIYGYFHSDETPNTDLLAKQLRYWNSPYGLIFGQQTGGNWGIGCHLERLKAQPTADPVQVFDGYLAVVDATLYNREELLDAPDGISDEELILKLVREKGMEALKEVNGDFAGGIFNAETGCWTLFRDHMGVRPLYYMQEEGLVAFSTDLRGLTAIRDARVNESQLFLRMMGYNDLSLTETEYANICCVPPASWVSLCPGYEPRVHTYWKLKTQRIAMKRDEDYVEALRELITDAVRRRLDAVDGLVGGELSGGLDSGIVDILISRLGREGRYFSWSESPEDLPLRQGEDERKVIADICRQENITCDYCKPSQRITPAEMVETCLPAYANTLTVSQTAQHLANQGVRAIFTGHGGDEGVSHRMSLTELWVHKEYIPFVKCIWQTTRGTKLRAFRTLSRIYKQIRYVNPHYRKPYHNTDINAEDFLNRDFRNRMEALAQKRPLPFAYDPAAYVMQGGSRRRLDNLALQGAAKGVRYMIPFLDYRVIDFAVSIPRRLYLKDGLNRWIFREAFRDMIPESLYSVRYKDTPSQRDQEPARDRLQKFRKARQQILGWLDRDFWKEYLDFAAIDAFDLPADHTPEDYTKAVFALDDLMQCVRLQTVAHSTKQE